MKSFQVDDVAVNKVIRFWTYVMSSSSRAVTSAFSSLRRSFSASSSCFLVFFSESWAASTLLFISWTIRQKKMTLIESYLESSGKVTNAKKKLEKKRLTGLKSNWNKNNCSTHTMTWMFFFWMAECTVAMALSETAGDLARVGDDDLKRAARDGEIGLLLKKSSSAPSNKPASTTSISPLGDPSSLEVLSASCRTAFVISRRVLWRISASSRMAARLASLWFSHSSDCFAIPLSCKWTRLTFELVIVSDTLLRSQFSSQICFRKRLVFRNQNINYMSKHRRFSAVLA